MKRAAPDFTNEIIDNVQSFLETGYEDYEYTEEQLLTLDLKKEEHAEAVQEWFYIKWSIQEGMLNPQAEAVLTLLQHNSTYRQLLPWWQSLAAFAPSVWAPPTVGDVERWADKVYAPVISEIRASPRPLRKYRGILALNPD